MRTIIGTTVISYVNYWFSYGKDNGAGAFPRYDPPYSWGATVTSSPVAKYCYYGDEVIEGVYKIICTGSNFAISSTKRWCGSRRTVTTGPTHYECVYTSQARRFDLYSPKDSLTGYCDDEPEPAASNGTYTRLLFRNNNEDLTGTIDGIQVLKIETLDDLWKKYTVQVNPRLPNGTYYFKGKTYFVPPTEGGGEYLL